MLRMSYKAEKGYKTIIKEIEVPIEKVISSFKTLRIQTVDKMREIIRTNKKRVRGEKDKLEDAITSEPIGDGKNTVGFGVGNISKLKSEAPHYLAINFGSSHIVGKKLPVGGFKPGEPKPQTGTDQKSRWFPGEGKYTFTVKNPIKPVDYIERTAFWLNDKIDKLMSLLRR